MLSFFYPRFRLSVKTHFDPQYALVEHLIQLAASLVTSSYSPVALDTVVSSGWGVKMNSMKTALIVALMGLVGCGTAQSAVTIDAELVELRVMFDLSMSERGHPEVRGMQVTMELRDYGPEEANTLGICYYTSKVGRGANVITMSRPFYEKASPEARALVFYHEAAHCLLDLDHRTDKIAIMNPHIGYFQMKMWKEHRERMIDELFN